MAGLAPAVATDLFDRARQQQASLTRSKFQARGPRESRRQQHYDFGFPVGAWPLKGAPVGTFSVRVASGLTKTKSDERSSSCQRLNYMLQ